MFGLLKKKLSNFSDKLKGKIENQTPLEVETKEQLVLEEPKKIDQQEKQVDQTPKKNIQPLNVKEKKSIIDEIKKEVHEEELAIEKEKIEESKTIEEISDEAEILEQELEIEVEKKEEVHKELTKEMEERQNIEVKHASEDKRELKSHVGTTGKLKGLFSGKVEIKEKDIEDLIWELELSLLESDVEQDTAKEIIEQIKKRLIGEKISMKNLDGFLKTQIKEILTEMMTTDTLDILEEIKKGEKPYIIMMLGPNGAGKTTHIAKLTHYFQKHNLSCVLAAADTFRSGAIDQLQEHADKLGVKLVKQQYGADPAAVAYDALTSAKANKFDVILIDTAGRQETNKNLMEELKKIERVVSPNLKIYVGESYTGQGLLTMAKDFDEAVGIDGFILTKIDADAKGGTTISLLYQLKKPIFYVGTGQGYDDLEKFVPEFIIDRII